MCAQLMSIFACLQVVGLAHSFCPFRFFEPTTDPFDYSSFTPHPCDILLLFSLFFCLGWPWRHLLCAAPLVQTLCLYFVRPLLLHNDRASLNHYWSSFSEFAHVLEQLETSFYSQALSKFQASDFTNAGFVTASIAVEQFTQVSTSL